MNELQSAIYNKCIDCVSEWKKENWHEPIDIDYDDYVNHCYNYGGSELASLIDELLDGSSDEEQQEFYNKVSYACEIANNGIRSAVGKCIRHYRLSRDWSQQKLADKAGITKANLCNIEAGKYSVGIDILNKITNALNIQIELLKV